MRSHFPFLALVLCWLALDPSITPKADANPGCPSNYLSCGGQTFYSTDADYVCPDYQRQWFFNLTSGSFEAVAGAPLNQNQISGFGVSDTYTVTGLPSGTPLSFHAVLTIHASAVIGLCGSCSEDHSARCSASIVDHGSAGTNTFSLNAPFLGYSGFPICMQACWGSSVVDTTLHLSLGQVAGESFTLEYDLSASAYNLGDASISAQLAFRDLPSGARVTSCQGYVEDFATASRSVTWGTLKARYH